MVQADALKDKRSTRAAAAAAPARKPKSADDEYVPSWSFNFADPHCADEDIPKVLDWLRRIGKTPADINWDPERNAPVDETITWLHKHKQKQAQEHGQPQQPPTKGGKTAAPTLVLGDDVTAVAHLIVALKGEDWAQRLAKYLRAECIEEAAPECPGRNGESHSRLN